ncbi:lipoprotein [Chitiniphilus shinanonensis]|uniref:Lipoprotein n=1 Tax=Chitiniphilus shinanonensis TaxID=553088 RepID=A0ABQ6BQT5_9NEIS|nr:LEA type 2 family protein [Chitiniphilus shinanonensis]GLS04380.1 lipoprotein [Chitiniphilus shinanonensis]
MRRLLTLCLILLLSACASLPTDLQKPRVSLAGISLKEAGLFEQRFTLTLRVENPNNVSLPIKGLDTTLAINDKPLASGVAPQSVTIPAMGEARLAIDVTSNLAALVRQLRAAKGEGGPRYRLTGKLFVPLRADGIPFELEGEVPAIEGLFEPAGKTQQF